MNVPSPDFNHPQSNKVFILVSILEKNPTILQIIHILLMPYLFAHPNPTKGAFNNYVDRILPFFDTPLPLCGQFLYPESRQKQTYSPK